MQVSLFPVDRSGIALAVQSVLGALDCPVVPRLFCVDGLKGIGFKLIALFR